VAPPALDATEQANLKAAVQAPPAAAGVAVANWNWKVVRHFLEHRAGVRVSRSTCLRLLHRLGFVYKRPKKRLLKADAKRRAAFIAEYAALLAEAATMGAKIFFVDEAHFRADADLRGMWVLKGEPALVDSTSPRWGEKASYYSAVCLETGEVEVMEVEGNSCAETSAAFLAQLRTKHPGPLIVIWDNGPAHGGDAIRAYLTTPDLALRLVRLPAYSPDFNADEKIWGWVREEVTANTCLGTKGAVQEKVGAFFGGLTERADEVRRRCRTTLQVEAEALLACVTEMLREIMHVDPVCASV
jgi:transposase